MIKNHLISFLILISGIISGNAQSYPPAAGFLGSDAIHKDSSVFIDWASEIVEVSRSYMDIAFPETGFVSYGEESYALGIADGIGVVSLGDNGSAVLSFNYPIMNGEGPDFAIFENAFFLNDTSENAFLEFAFVEVSSNGDEYIRFPAYSEIQTETQIGSFTHLNARYVHNLAGKCTALYGTPFDLDDLSDISGGTSVDLNEIRYVKIVDVIGTIDESYASYDSKGNIINDPYPTPFVSGGFDLDAIGVINNTQNTLEFKNNIKIIPNPASDFINIHKSGNTEFTIQIFDSSGVLVSETRNQTKIYIKNLRVGLYIVKSIGIKRTYTSKFFKN